MQARSRHITCTNGIEFETPLLVPGFSSMAMGPLPSQEVGKKPKPIACSMVHSEVLSVAIDEVLLVSAYDIHHKFLSDSKSFSLGFKSSRYAHQKFLMIDSGWYEKMANMGGGLFIDGQEQPLPWELNDYETTIDGLDHNVKAVVVSFDSTEPYPKQIAKAQDFANSHSQFASTILLKPPKSSRFHQFEKLSKEDASNLRVFDIIGVTEKELGDSILTRLVTLAKFRLFLDEAEIFAPIHVFGGLDILYTPLFFAAGAEIFDGVGWLRYAYREGMPVHREAGALLDNPVDTRWMRALTTNSFQNLKALGDLASELRVFAHNDGDWSKIRHTGDLLRPIHEAFDAALGRNYGR